MKVTVVSGLGFALLWIIFKLVFFWTNALEYNIVPSVLLNMLFLLLAIAVGLYLYKRKEREQGNALNDIKNGMTAALPYTIVVSVFIYFYYNTIDPGFNEHQIAEAHAGIQKILGTPEGLQSVRDSNPEFEVLSKEEIYNKLKEGPEGFYNPTSTMTLSMLAMLLLGTLNSIFISIIYRKVVFR